ncbi:MAG: NapC/NirT family cytochrome c, partial [Thermodesulfobacteriota bacterium]|nr:NapC/NirT family cytochrome c [Thermodesulfobacteriota bacterium]
QHKGGGLYRNAVSFFGAYVAIISIFLILFTLLLMFSFKSPSPYIGIFSYMVFPAFFTLGVFIFLYGMRRESIRRRKLGVDEALPYPRLDLNDPKTRKTFSYAIIGGSFLAILLAFISYHAFLYTETVSFCGQLCHTVMQPEYVSYEASPHARVPCVDCHVGAGASWYVKSKISGARQVLAVLLNTYPRPIPTPIENLRPARETCEECHWPAKFFGTQLMQIPHFRYDEQNSPEQISLGIKTGGGSGQLGENAGIHWHMITENKVHFIATDRKEQEIPWIRSSRQDGTEDVYITTDYKGDPEELASREKREMDCMDCHNRPTHIYEPPDAAVDKAMASYFISRTLPWVKKVVVDALVVDYPSREKAVEGLRTDIATFYRDKYPNVYKSRKADVEKAIDTAINIYDQSVFPDMKVNWKTYATNIGHRNWPGCFRCHDGKHVTKNGKVLTTDCTTCHTMPERGPLSPLGAMMPGPSKLKWHPMDLEGKHGRILCNKCHEAGYRPPIDCAECHKIDTSAPMMSMACADCHEKKFEAQPVTPCRECHEKLPGLHRKGEHPDLSCTECHRPHVWEVTGRDTCLSCHDDKMDHNKEEGACTNCHDFRGKAAPGKARSG